MNIKHIRLLTLIFIPVSHAQKNKECREAVATAFDMSGPLVVLENAYPNPIIFKITRTGVLGTCQTTIPAAIQPVGIANPTNTSRVYFFPKGTIKQVVCVDATTQKNVGEKMINLITKSCEPLHIICASDGSITATYLPSLGKGCYRQKIHSIAGLKFNKTAAKKGIFVSKQDLLKIATNQRGSTYSADPFTDFLIIKEKEIDLYA